MDSVLSKTRVLVVEDEIVVSEDLQQRLAALGFEVTGSADTAPEALDLAVSTRPDIVLMDIMLHGRPEGIGAAERLRNDLDMPVIYLTAHSDAATLERAKLTDPAGYIVKPFDDQQLRVAIELAPVRHEMERKARRVARWLSATLSSMGEAVIATNVHGQVLMLNPTAEKLTGWTQLEAAGKPCGDVLRLINHHTGQLLQDPATRALHHGLVVRLDPDTVLLTRFGEERFVDDSASPITDETGKILGAVVVLVDASDRMDAEGRVQTLTRRVVELMAEKERERMLGADLEAFAAAVSHDLRSPLRAITGFSELLASQHRERLDPSGQQFLERVRANALQMSRMVEDYLIFLKATREELLRAAAVDVQGLAQEVFAELVVIPGQKPATFACAALPRAWGDAAMLRQVWVNLIGNALKYSARQELPIVEVGASAGDAFHTYFVRDNGVGLDIAGAARLFEPFQRFHSAADFPGTGVGLAVVKRIVERHGGLLWVHSQPGSGATFFFTLPAGPPSEPNPAARS